MLPDSEIKRYGGKGAIINHVAANIPEMHIPRYIIKRQEDSFDGIIPEFNSMKKPVIVRSSSPHEYGDYEGIFDSLKGITDEYSLIRAIEQIEASAKSEHAKRYAEINSFPLDDTIHAIIQEQSDSRYCGAMMRHPNNPDLIFMSLYLSEFDIGFDNRQRYFNYLFDEQKNTKRKNIYFTTNSDFSENTARFLAEKYRQIEALTDSANGYSLFVEFGLKPFQFYQARPFKKIETADFELPKILESKDSLSTKLVFGITPEDGIVLPVIRSIGYMEAKLLNPLKFVGMDETEKISLDGMADMSLLMSLENAHDCSKESLEPQKYLNQAIENWNLSMDDSL
ncbi:MAG: hypothetical protein KAI53_02515, partial [Candidatus Aenigmarchaeota archaeon]|nr:hypothetical protein [Candidatus Aenigmarchaeota archaeon]